MRHALGVVLQRGSHDVKARIAGHRLVEDVAPEAEPHLHM
jgi:hypothetical protein